MPNYTKQNAVWGQASDGEGGMALPLPPPRTAPEGN